MNIYRASYTAADLDPLTGPVPTYGNPGSTVGPQPTRRDFRTCRTCDVTWTPNEGRACWSCGSVPGVGLC